MSFSLRAPSLQLHHPSSSSTGSLVHKTSLSSSSSSSQSTRRPALGDITNKSNISIPLPTNANPIKPKVNNKIKNPISTSTSTHVPIHTTVHHDNIQVEKTAGITWDDQCKQYDDIMKQSVSSMKNEMSSMFSHLHEEMKNGMGSGKQAGDVIPLEFDDNGNFHWDESGSNPMGVTNPNENPMDFSCGLDLDSEIDLGL